MCGIVGVIAKPAVALTVSPQDMGVAVDLLKHRGPDTQHVAALYPNGNVTSHPVAQWRNIELAGETPIAYLGHARLKIIDRSDAANQPFQYLALNGKSYWVIYNGEIYNYLPLKEMLVGKGYSFNTHCDTEILPALYDLMGGAMVKELNGMFAFAIWDATDAKLFLARDRYGIKPLYTTRLDNGALAFASELKSLISLPGISKAFNYQALYEHFTFQFSLSNQTFIQGINHFPKGYYATWDSQTGGYEETQYWEPVFREDAGKTDADWFSSIERLLGQSVASQLLGDMPVGSFLSGGIDTGAIMAIAAKQHKPMYTVTCGFDTSALAGEERLFDEREPARTLAGLFHTVHHEHLIDCDTLPTVLDKLVWHLDDFQAGISYQNLVTAGTAKEYMTVILSGVGGDELFAGYPWRHQLALDSSLSEEQFEDAYYQKWVRLLDDGWKQKLFSTPVLGQVQALDTKRLFQHEFRSGNASTPLQKALCFDMRHFLPALLAVEDRLSMAYSLESRVPFLDNRLVDLCLSMPDILKLRKNGDGDVTSKYALRQALSTQLPEWVLSARKQGFTPPDATWYRGKLAAWIESRLFSDSFLNRDIVRPDVLKELWQQHQSGEKNHRFLIWSLLCLESWCRQFMDSETPVAV